MLRGRADREQSKREYGTDRSGLRADRSVLLMQWRTAPEQSLPSRERTLSAERSWPGSSARAERCCARRNGGVDALLCSVRAEKRGVEGHLVGRDAISRLFIRRVLASWSDIEAQVNAPLDAESVLSRIRIVEESGMFRTAQS